MSKSKLIFFLAVLILISPAYAEFGTFTTNGTNASTAQSNVTLTNTNITYQVTAWNVGSGIKTMTLHSFNTSSEIQFTIANNTPGIVYEIKANGSAVQGYQADSQGLLVFNYTLRNNKTLDLRPSTNVGGNNVTWSWFWDVVIRNGSAYNFNIYTGTLVNVTKFNASEFEGNGAKINSLNANNISTGTLADARLSSNVVLANKENYNVTLINSTIDMRNLTVNDTGLVLYMKFDENSTGTATSTKIYDSSKYANDGTWNGHTVPNWTNGRFGGALQFDGSNDYVDAGNEASLNINNTITISAWTKPEIVSTSFIVAKTAAGIAGGYVISISGNKFEIYDGTTALTGTTNILTNRWYHVVGISSGTTLELYINGVKESSVSSVPNLITANQLNIGKGSGGSPYHFNGTIDEVRIYNRALSADEVRTLYYSNPLNEKSSFIQSNLTRFINNSGYTTFAVNSTGAIVNGTWNSSPILSPYIDPLILRNNSDIIVRGITQNLTNKSVDYTLTLTDSVLIVNATSTTYVTLPTAVGNLGKTYWIKKKDASSNVVAISSSNAASLIDGARYANISTQYNSITVISDGLEWNII